jgi:hypothetical protein
MITDAQRQIQIRPVVRGAGRHRTGEGRSDDHRIVLGELQQLITDLVATHAVDDIHGPGTGPPHWSAMMILL